MTVAEAALEAHDVEQRNCQLCPRLCHHACPVSNADRDEAVTPREKNAAAGQLRTGDLEADADTTALFYKCLGCGLCTTFCEHENAVGRSLFAARAVAVERGTVLPEVEALLGRFRDSGNPYGVDLRGPLDALPDDRKVGTRGPVRRDRGRVPAILGRGRRVLWAGCDTLHHRPDLVERTLAVADRLGEADLVVYAGEVQCCGYPLLAAGDLEGFRAQARKVEGALDGARAVFTGSPECAWTLQVAYPEIAGIDPPAKTVGHLVDLLRPALRHAPTAPPLDLDLVYHDPCYLGRHLGKTEAPRELVRHLSKRPLGEAAPFMGAHGYCSGGGGLLPDTSPQTADAITRARVADLTGTSSGIPGEAPAGEKIIVTACPTCEGRFRDAGARALDLVDVVAAYLGMEIP